MGSIRDKLNSIAKTERLFSLDELYDKEDSMSWNEFFSELVKKVKAIGEINRWTLPKWIGDLLNDEV